MQVNSERLFDRCCFDGLCRGTESLIPEQGMPSARRFKLIESTITVLGPDDREELANLSRLRSTLFAASLQDLRKIEANFKERLADAE